MQVRKSWIIFDKCINLKKKEYISKYLINILETFIIT